ncbi:MAG: hypothetical protein J0J01_19760 [Reyranella sp.]|uniref:hypothetical protein n=1 Tax=Reyranella sp. TaxID=1929291 RepID=UPI001AD0EC1A|nr:hypothetical protein [Reyranella sp.]MBN9089149.1 hypothetical protein [Reyranella sp.]
MTASTQRRSEPEVFDLPDTVDLAAVNAAEIEIIRLAAQRRMTPLQALRFSRLLDHRRRAIADRDLEEQMEKLERDTNGGNP